MKINYLTTLKTQAPLPFFAWYARVQQSSRTPAIRYVQRLGVPSPSMAALIAELAGLNVGADHD